MALIVDVRRILALVGMGIGFLGFLFTLFSYFAMAPAMAGIQTSAQAQFLNLDSVLSSAEITTTNLGSTVREKPVSALQNVDTAIKAYASSAEELSASLEGTSSILPLGGLSRAAQDLRASARSMRNASADISGIKQSLNSTAMDIENTAKSLDTYRTELSSTGLQVDSAISSMRTAHLLITLAALAGFLALMVLCGALLIDAPHVAEQDSGEPAETPNS